MLEGTFPNDEAEPFSFKGLPELEREKQWYRDCINQVMPNLQKTSIVRVEWSFMHLKATYSANIDILLSKKTLINWYSVLIQS